MQPLIEIILYALKPGTGAAFLALMRDVSVPLHRESGIDVVWHGPSMHDPDAYGLIRAFPDMAALESLQSAFYASAGWRSGPREGIVSRIETSVKIILPMRSEGIEGLRQEAAVSSDGYRLFTGNPGAPPIL